MADDTTAAARDELVGRLFEATLGTWDLLAVYVGDKLGLYQAMADRGTLTSSELADATGTHERYVREWLEQQATSGILDVDDADVAQEVRVWSPSGPRGGSPRPDESQLHGADRHSSSHASAH